MEFSLFAIGFRRFIAHQHKFDRSLPGFLPIAAATPSYCRRAAGAAFYFRVFSSMRRFHIGQHYSSRLSILPFVGISLLSGFPLVHLISTYQFSRILVRFSRTLLITANAKFLYHDQVYSGRHDRYFFFRPTDKDPLPLQREKVDSARNFRKTNQFARTQLVNRRRRSFGILEHCISPKTKPPRSLSQLLTTNESLTATAIASLIWVDFWRVSLFWRAFRFVRRVVRYTFYLCLRRGHIRGKHLRWCSREN